MNVAKRQLPEREAAEGKKVRGRARLRERREREKEELRHEILDAARELFVTEGFENVSMRRIADKIDYSPTTIYLYFKDKGDLLFHICEETFAKLIENMEAISKDTDDPVEALRKGCQAYVEFGLKYPNHYRVTFMNPTRVEMVAERQLNEETMGMRAYCHLRGEVEACIKQQRFRHTDVDAATQALWAASHGITSLFITKPNFHWVDRKQLAAMLTDILIEGLKA